MKEYTYIMIKPDGVRKGLTSEIVKRIQDKGFKIELFDVRKLNADILAEHYSHLVDKPFYPTLRDFMLSDYVVPMLVSGENAVLGMRELMGPTNSADAEAGTIRGDFGNKSFVTENVIHGSDSLENALIEIKRFFDLDLTQGEEFNFNK